MEQKTCWEIASDLERLEREGKLVIKEEEEGVEEVGVKDTWLFLFSDQNFFNFNPKLFLNEANCFFSEVGYPWYAVEVEELEEQYKWGLVQS